MPTDLEEAIRSALTERAEAVVLRQPGRRASRPHRSHTWLIAAAVVAVLAVAIPLAVWRGGGGDKSSPANGQADYVGYRWQVVGVVDDRGPLTLPGGAPGSIAYLPDGSITASDTLNGITGRFEQTSTGYTVQDVAIGDAGYIGTDPARARLILAVDAMFAGFGDATEQPPVEVTASVTGTTLTLRVGSTTLTLVRGGPPLPVPESPTVPTSTAPSR